jgi:ABC-type transport system involved in multi-copper enzyme maturation permease subunit
MIPSLFMFELKQLLRRLFVLAMVSFLLGLAAVWLYTPDMLSKLRLWSEEVPFFTRLLGYAGSANLPVHMMGVLYGFLLPAMFVANAQTLALRLVARPIGDGRIAQRLAAPHRRGPIILTLFWLVVLEALIISLAVFLGQVAGVFIFLGGQADFLALLRMSMGLMLSSLPAGGVMVWVAAASPGRISAMRMEGLVVGLFLGLLLASRLAGWPRWLGSLTPFSLFKGQELIADTSKLLLSALGLPIALILAGFGAWAFSRRDL